MKNSLQEWHIRCLRASGEHLRIGPGRKVPFMLKTRQRYISSAMFALQASVMVLLCTLISWTSAIPKPPARHFGSGAGEIPGEHGTYYTSTNCSKSKDVAKCVHSTRL
ncbi:hypothetical protein TNCV_1230021 [Trichonephila clavipes]|nr:hypothetical protein TNCV_1230021 [Trichonephila clavipes]